jgi:hypothetical protein
VEAAGAVSKRRLGGRATRRRAAAAGQQGRPRAWPAGAFSGAEAAGNDPPSLAHGRPALGGWRFNRMSAANFPSCPNLSENRRKPSVTSAHDRLLSAHRPRRRGAGQ